MQENKDQLMQEFEKIQKANRDGYAGCLPNGNLVDRREHPEAYPVVENSMFDISKPRCIQCNKQVHISSLENSICTDCRK